MDTITQQLISFCRRVRNDLVAIRNALVDIKDNLQKQHESVHENQEANDHSHNPPPVIRAELQVPHPIEVQTDPKDKHKTRENFKLLVSTLTLLFVAAYTFTTLFIFCATKKSADAAKSSADTARLQLRPWIAATSSCLIADSFYRKVHKCQWEWTEKDGPKPPIDTFAHIKDREDVRWWVAVINTGQTPALRATLSAGWCVSDKPETSPPILTDSGCTPYGPTPGRPVFPNADPYMKITRAFSMPPSQYALIRPSEGPQTKLVGQEKFFYLVGESDYFTWDDHDPKKHSTHFCLVYDPAPEFSLRYCQGGQTAD